MRPPAEPGRVLRLALVAWGLGHFALGRALAGALLLAAEAAALAALALLAVVLVGTTLQLVAFVAGIGFIVGWAWQAVAAYRSARALLAPPPDDSELPVPERSPATSIAWLALPLLLWTSGFWLLPADAAAPAAAVDRFVSAWTADHLAGLPPHLTDAADEATERLRRLCMQGRLRSGCEAGGTELFRDVRVRLASTDSGSALAIAEAVRYERRNTSFLWVFPGSELVPVPIEPILELRLEAHQAAARLLGLGGREWRIVAARSG